MGIIPIVALRKHHTDQACEGCPSGGRAWGFGSMILPVRTRAGSFVAAGSDIINPEAFWRKDCP